MIGQRLKELRLKKGLTLQQVGDLFGINRASVAGWERGESQPSPEKLPKLAKAYGVSIEYLLTGGFTYVTKFRDPQEINEPRNQYKQENKVPLLSNELAAKWSDVGPTWRPDQETKFISCPCSYGIGSFALEVTGIAMEPRFTEGDIIFIDPLKQPEHKKFVIAKIKNDDIAILRQFIVEGSGQFLCTLNGSAPAERFTIIDENVKICGVVIGKWREE